jgi:Aminoglycoside-2''-adenylyltransferase
VSITSRRVRPAITEQYRAHLDAIRRLHNQFEADHVDYWLFGGWAVDFHVGRITRAHSDIDIAIWLKDRERVAERMQSDGWRIDQDAGQGYAAFTSGPVRAELAFLRRDNTGGIFTPSGGGQASWPRNAFGADLRKLEGVSARVIGLPALIEDKSAGYGGVETQMKDRADVAVLRGRAR